MHYDEYEDEPVLVIERQGGGMGTFIWGAAIGAAVALLFAPQSGIETRREIKRRARKAKRQARDQVDAVQDAVVDRYESARRQVEDRIDDVRSAVELKKRQAQEAVRAGRQAASDARLELEKRIAEGKAAYDAGAEVARGTRKPASEGGGTGSPAGTA